MNWLGVQFASAPAFYRYYLYYTIGNALAKRLVPGLHAQVFTGTTLGMLKTVSPARYSDAVAGRLTELLSKQAQLRAPKGQAPPRLPPEVLEAAAKRLKEDEVLTEALGSTAALAIWHKLERTRLDDPELLKDKAPESQARWILEALRAGYMDQLEESSRGLALAKAAEDASKALKGLSEAVTAASLAAEHGLVEATNSNELAQVEKASKEAAAAVKALEKAKAEDPIPQSAVLQRRQAWEAKLIALQSEHAAVPAVAAELQRLAAPSAAAAGS